MPYLNIAAYKFIRLEPESLITTRQQLLEKAQTHRIKGSILLSTEGINLFLAAEPEAIRTFIDFLQTFPAFADLEFKFSDSAKIPYKRLLIRIKSEIITMKQPQIEPEKQRAPYIEPTELKQWYDSKTPMLVLDTRNNYEFTHGSFVNAVHLDIANFSDFPEALTQLPESYKSLPVVTFCTGGIRCEKAATYMLEQGFTQARQLKGGILNYFAECAGEYFQGNCFVFDERVALNTQLQPIA